VAPNKAADEGAVAEAVAPAAGSPDEALAGRDLEAALGKALAELPERERIAFSLCRFEGLPYKEIAAALDTSEPAVKSLIHRATVTVAERLTPLVGANPLEAVRGVKES
jgi:RNA polymerase sigma-70 factor, ECF subfamily